YELAVEQYQRVLQLTPNAVDAQVHLGEAFRLQGDLPKAIAILEKARKAAPKDLQPLVLLAFTLQKAGRVDEAIASYRQALELAPNHGDVLNNLAFLLAEKGGNLVEAQQFAQRALLYKKNDPRISDTLGW